MHLSHAGVPSPGLPPLAVSAEAVGPQLPSPLPQLVQPGRQLGGICVGWDRLNELGAEIGTSKSVRRLNAMQNDRDFSVKYAAEQAVEKIRARLKAK